MTRQRKTALERLSLRAVIREGLNYYSSRPESALIVSCIVSTDPLRATRLYSNRGKPL